MTCKNCQNRITQNAVFCGKCGAKKEDTKSTSDYNQHIKKVAIIFFTLVTYITILNLSEITNNKTNSIINDVIFSVIVLIFAFYDRKTIKRIIQKPKGNKKLILYIVIIAPIFAFLVHHFADLLNEHLFHQMKISDVQQTSFSIFNFSISILSIAIFPAIFEELAFRGVIFEELTKIANLKIAIIISSILFAILHFSLISILWIFPSGIVLGYLRAKYRNLWYGILGHFIYNSSIVIIETLNR